MSAKSERERRRQERLAAEQQELANARRRLVFGYVVAGALALAVIVGLVVALGGSGGSDASTDFPANAHVQVNSGFTHGYSFDGRQGTPPPPLQQGDLKTAAAAAGCELKLNLPNEGNTHITKESQIPDYKTNPPTSGNHNPEQLADGAYSEMPAEWYFVHSLEHGRIEIQYSPKLPNSDQLALKGVFDQDPPGMLFFPNTKMPYEVAVTAWQNLMGCPKYEGPKTLDAIRDFRDTYRGLGPEPLPIDVPG
ncbi:MAG: DUF3105 domain-containing protein [Solirubrobacterales bacterium]